MSLLSLPRELLMLIAYNLPYEDVMSYRSINKSFHSLIDERFWERKFNQESSYILPYNSGSYADYYIVVELIRPFLTRGISEFISLCRRVQQAIDQGEEGIKKDYSLRFIHSDRLPIRLFSWTDGNSWLIGDIYVYSFCYASDPNLSTHYGEMYLTNDVTNIDFELSNTYEKVIDDDGRMYCVHPESMMGFAEYLNYIIDQRYLPLSSVANVSEKVIQRFPDYFMKIGK